MEKKVFNFQVGNDNGNSEQDIIIDGDLVCQPNVFAKVSQLPLLDEVNIQDTVEHLEDKLIVTVNSPSAAPGIYYVGNYALNSGKRLSNMEVGVLNDKASSDIVIVNTLAQIAAKAVKMAYKEGKLDEETEILVNVDMTTALPVTQYNSKAAEKLQNKFMAKKHNVIVHLKNLRIDIDIVFDFVKVLPESVPVVFALQKAEIKTAEQLTDEEKTKNETVKRLFQKFNTTYNMSISGEYFKNKKIQHVAIGEGTTEYPITNNIIFNPDFIAGSDNGVGHAIENAMPEFKHMVGLRTYTRQNYSSIIRDEEHKYYNYAVECLEAPLEAESQDILHNVKAEIEKANNDVDIVCVHGGGSILMKKYLYDNLFKLGGKADIKLFYVPEEFAVTLEVRGLYEFTKGEIFKKLKENYIK